MELLNLDTMLLSSLATTSSRVAFKMKISRNKTIRKANEGDEINCTHNYENAGNHIFADNIVVLASGYFTSSLPFSVAFSCAVFACETK